MVMGVAGAQGGGDTCLYVVAGKADGIFFISCFGRQSEDGWNMVYFILLIVLVCGPRASTSDRKVGDHGFETHSSLQTFSLTRKDAILWGASVTER